MLRSRGRGLALIALAAISWGTTGSVTAVLVERAGAGALVIGALRMVVAAALLLLLARAAGPLRIARADRWRCAALGVCMAAFQACYFSAVTMTGIAIAALIAICSAPLIIAGLAAATLGERLTARVGAALGLGVTGTALLIVGPRTAADLSPRFVAGVALALAAGLAYALYVVLAKAALARTAPLPLAGVTFTVGALVLAPVLAAPGVGHQIALGWPWLLYLGAITTAGAYAIYTLGLREVTASVAGIASLMEPLTATLLGVFLFGERLGAAGVAGALLLFAALGLLLTHEAA
ncbi:MAG TPA: EamA family transporter [Candidatus Binatia bacterium]|nr:EamA family transporter [Candidatus Binatia bacterium]